MFQFINEFLQLVSLVLWVATNTSPLIELPSGVNNLN